MNTKVSKANLTRAINSGDPLKVIRVCNEAFEKFNTSGYPDNWHDWLRAEGDAISALAQDGEDVSALIRMHCAR